MAEHTTKDTEVDDFDVEENDPTMLGDAATEALNDLAADGYSATQDVLEETDYLKVRFVGMSFDSLDKNIKIGDEMTFTVRARCVGTAEEASKVDGQIRHIAKMDVQSVTLKD